MDTANKESIAVKKMKTYIQDHLQVPLTASDVAKAAGYSQYHAARLFKKEVGLSPFEYIRRERLLASAYALRNHKPKVFDIALDYVFDSHEGFTRSFSNAFGIAPKKYADYPIPNGWLIPYRYLNRQRTKMEELIMNSVIFTQIVERPARKLILRRSKTATHYHEYVDEVECDAKNASIPWDILCGIKEALYEPIGLWLPENMRPEGTGIYAHGVEVPHDYSGQVPEEFDVIELPPCKMLVFQGEPYDDKYYQKAVGACMELIEKFNPEVYGYQYADELAPKKQLAPQGWRGYIEMRPVQELK